MWTPLGGCYSAYHGYTAEEWWRPSEPFSSAVPLWLQPPTDPVCLAHLSDSISVDLAFAIFKSGMNTWGLESGYLT